MRYVRSGVMKLKLDVPIDWTKAKLRDAYFTPHFNLEDSIENATFDFTKPLIDIVYFTDPSELNSKSIGELTSHVFVPSKGNNPGFDCIFFCEMSDNTTTTTTTKITTSTNNLCVFVIENKYTVLGNTTQLDENVDIWGKHENTVKQLKTLKYNKLVFVVMARRPYHRDNQTNSKPNLPVNTIVVSQPYFHSLIGPSLLKLLQSGESMIRRVVCQNEQAQPTHTAIKVQCSGKTSKGLQCKRYTAEKYCFTHMPQVEEPENNQS